MMTQGFLSLAPYIRGGKLNLDLITDSDFDQRLLAALFQVINASARNTIRGVHKDIDNFLSWMLVGGKRPTFTLRTTNIGGVNGYQAAQDTLCEALNEFHDRFDWDDRMHFALLERATRPLPGTTPLVPIQS